MSGQTTRLLGPNANRHATAHILPGTVDNLQGTKHDLLPSLAALNQQAKRAKKNENAEVMDPNANFTNMHNFNLPLSMRTIDKEPHQEDMLLADEGEGEERS